MHLLLRPATVDIMKTTCGLAVMYPSAAPFCSNAFKCNTLNFSLILYWYYILMHPVQPELCASWQFSVLELWNDNSAIRCTGTLTGCWAVENKELSNLRSVKSHQETMVFNISSISSVLHFLPCPICILVFCCCSDPVYPHHKRFISLPRFSHRPHFYCSFPDNYTLRPGSWLLQ